MLRFAALCVLAACASAPPPAASPTRTTTTQVTYVSDPAAPPWPPLVSGTLALGPDAATVAAARAEYTRLRSNWKICIDETGAVSLVEKLQTSGFPDYDAAVRRGLMALVYEPLVVDGAPKPACKAVSLVYDLPAD